MYFQVVAYEPL